jgi:PKHD-type hydroxylase
MDYKIIHNLLTQEEVNDIYLVINSVNVEWQQGYETVRNLDNIPTTAESVKGFKNCISLLPYTEIADIIFQAIDKSHDWINFTLPTDSETPFVSRTPTGGYYRPHHDASKNGHFSTTIFLNNPDDYEGGELQLDLNGEIKNVKLSAGSSITYRTGIPHCVNEVTKGNRDVAVFWTKTEFPDQHEWMIMGGIRKAMSLLECKNHANLEEAREDPYFVLATLMHNIERKTLSKTNDNS